MGGGGEPTLMEACERDNVAVGRRWHVFLAGQQQLLGRGPRTEKTAMDEASICWKVMSKWYHRSIRGGDSWMQAQQQWGCRDKEP